jgi:hypothetical protein
MPELEYILMKQTSLPYRSCRQLVLDSRKTLGMCKYEPWTENLRGAALRLYAARYVAHKSATDADSTTIGSFSLDGSEEITHEGMLKLIDEISEKETLDEVSGKKKANKVKNLFGRIRRSGMKGALCKSWAAATTTD